MRQPSIAVSFFRVPDYNAFMDTRISVIIPNRNGSATIGTCLEAAFSSRYDDFEVVVVDDCSEDDSVEIIKRFPCRLIKLEGHSGASKARNAGAASSTGGILFFTDADCLLREDTLSVVMRAMAEQGPGIIVGGTYTREPCDKGFFSRFQSVFINYSETKHADNPDYVASHAMAVDAGTFRKSGGFPEDFLPILEDVEFSHRLRRMGCRLIINPRILVQHIFNFSLAGSLRNAVKKATYWTLYSIRNRDLLADSGTASRELKFNVVSCFLNLIFLMTGAALLNSAFLYSVLVFVGLNTLINWKLLRAFRDAGGAVFAFSAYAYYTMLYPLAVGAGSIAGMMRCLSK